MRELGSLPLFHQIAGKAVLVLGDGQAAEPKRRLIERAGGVVVADQALAIAEGVRIAFVAYDDANAGELAASELRDAGMLVNVVDRPDLCDFTTPSIVDRNPVLIAVGTGGASAGLAKHIRLRLERILPQTLGTLAVKLFNGRSKLRAKFPEAGDRRRALDTALRQGGALDPLNADTDHRVDNWLNDSAVAPDHVNLSVTLSSADPDDLTIRQSRLLGEADVICADPKIPAEILARARADARRLICDSSICARGCDANEQSGAICPKLAEMDDPSGLSVILRWKS